MISVSLETYKKNRVKNMGNTAINKTFITADNKNGIIHQPVDDYTEHMIDIANSNKLEYYEINEINEEMMSTFKKSMITDDNDTIIINNEYRAIMQFYKLYMQLFWALPLKMHEKNMTTEMLASHEWSIRTAVYMIQASEGFHNALFDSDARAIDFYSKHYTQFTPEECDEVINRNRIDVLINMLGNNNAYIYKNHDLFDGTGPDEWFRESALTRRRIANEFKDNKEIRLAVARQRNYEYNYDNIHNGQYNLLIDDPDEEVRMAALASYYNVSENAIRTMRIAEPWLAGNYDNYGSDKIDYYFRMFDMHDDEAIDCFYQNHPQARIAIQDAYYKQYYNGHRHEHMPLDTETALRNLYRKYGLTK